LQAPRRIEPALIPSAAELLAEAFFTNPAHVYFCLDPCTRRARLEWLLGGNLRIQPDLDASFCRAEASRVDAMGFWIRPGAPTLGALAKLRAGILAAPFRLGLDGLRRLGEVTRAIDDQRDRALGNTRHWYLNNMVVRKELRGTGVGTRILGEQLERLAREDPRAAAALSTQREENVVFYGRLGFEVVLDEPIGQGDAAFRNWIMLRPPER
jgi:GNAT superfamily N-acetyltransferase